MDRPDSKASSLLSRLRQQSDAVRAAETAAAIDRDILLDMEPAPVDACSASSTRRSRTSRVIKPVSRNEFRIDQLVSLSGLQFERASSRYRRRHLAGQELLDYVEAFYRLAADSGSVLARPTDRRRHSRTASAMPGHRSATEAEQDERR